MRKYAEWLLAATMVACALVTIETAVRILQQPFELNFGEADVLNAGVRIVKGLTPYPNPREWPVILNPYGPVFYLGVALAVKIFGVGFAAPRLLVLSAAVGLVVVLMLLLWRWTHNWAVAVAFACAFLWFQTALWATVLRVDVPAVALSLLGLYLFVAHPRKWVGAAMVFVLALLCKITAVAAPAACVLWLLWKRNPVRAAKFAGLLALLLALGFAVTQWWSGGYFLFHTFWTHPDLYDWHLLWRKTTEQLLANWVFALLTLIYLANAVRLRRLELPFFYICLALLGTVTAGKVGANTNHLLESSAALCLGGGLGWTALAEAASLSRRATAFMGLVAVGIAAGTLLSYHSLDYGWTGAGCAAVYDAVRRSPGERVLSENVGAVVLAGKEVMISDPFVYTQLVERAGWSDRELQERIRQHYFDLIVIGGPLYSQRWSAGVRQTIAERYRAIASSSCPDANTMLVPRDTGTSEAPGAKAGQPQ